MYRTVRLIHLLSGLFLTTFLAIYGLSAVQMAHRGWFPLRQVVTRESVPVPPGISDARSAARLLMDRGAVRGELRRVMGPLQFQIARPGTTQDVTCLAAACTIVTTSTGAFGVLNRLHQTAGFGSSLPILNMWGALMSLVSLGLFLMGASGLYLWFAGRDMRTAGTILMAGAVVFTGYLIVSMRI